MALNPISLDERLRPWRLAGISHLLMPEGFMTAAQAQTPPSPSLFRPAEAHQRPARPRPFLGSEPPKPQVAPPPGPALRAEAATPIRRQAAFENWPRNWRDRLKATPAAPIVWTYPELGEDLSGQGDKARSACLRELIGTLGLPRGSSAFWPLALPSPATADAPAAPPDGMGDTNSNSLYFLQGLARLNPRALILFGSRSISLSGLDLPADGAFTQSITQGRLHIILPELSALLASRQTLTKTSIYLRSSLSKLPGIFR